MAGIVDNIERVWAIEIVNEFCKKFTQLLLWSWMVFSDNLLPNHFKAIVFFEHRLKIVQLQDRQRVKV